MADYPKITKDVLRSQGDRTVWRISPSPKMHYRVTHIRSQDSWTAERIVVGQRADRIFDRELERSLIVQVKNVAQV